MIIVEIEWMKTLFIHETQVKKFKDEMSCVEWCRKNYEHILSINGNPTLGNPIGHFDAIHHIRRKKI